jgi:glycosyltransferase involved in cell wall biosynthesis
VGKVVLTGPRDDIAGLMQHLSVFCLTSVSEGMPNVVLEAMAAGLPVVATRVGDLPDLIEHGRNGFLTGVNDVEAFAEHVERLLLQPELARRVGENARTSVLGSFGCRRMAQEIEALYQKLLALPEASPPSQTQQLDVE